MSRKKHRVRDQQPKVTKQVEQPPEVAETKDENITRYKAVVRSPIGEWWHENKKRARLFALIGGGGLLVGWLLFEFFSLVF